MNWQRITARDNAQIKAVIRLRDSSRARKDNKTGVLEGLRLCTDAAENGISFRSFFVSDSALLKWEKELERLTVKCENRFLIPDTLFRKISDTDSPQGILALFALPENLPLANPNGRYVGLENLSDPSNLGAIARTAEALGIDGILLTNNGTDPYSPKVLRASMGTVLRMPLYLTDDLIQTAKEFHLKTYACVVDRTAKPITDVSFADGCLLLIGNEANGLTQSTKQNADECITIPMTGFAESLNAAAAGAIALWETVREKNK